MTRSNRLHPITAQATIASPLGDILLARSEQGLAGVWFTEDQKYLPGPLAVPQREDDTLLLAAASQLRAYFAAELTQFDLPLDLHGTPFQQAVWQSLLDIAAGRTCSYGDIARRTGTPLAVRAVGAAVGRNPVSVIVPCHRVIGSAGSLTGYGGGLHRKQALLELEGVLPSPDRPAAGRQLVIDLQ